MITIVDEATRRDKRNVLMETARRLNYPMLHKIIGLTLVAPFLAWITTAFVFYFKPGYSEAYAFLQFKTYPLESVVILPPNPEWLEIRHTRTVLGPHLCVRTPGGWVQIDPLTNNNPRPFPNDTDLTRLLHDAFSVNPERYGTVDSISGTEVSTSTGVRVTVDWNTMSLSQRGSDTDLIDALYRIHYLQWTGISAVDKVLGPVGLVLVLLLSFLGLRLAIWSPRNVPRNGNG